MVYFCCGDAGLRESEPYDPQGDRQKAARYAAIQRSLWGKNNLPPRGRPRRSRVLLHHSVQSHGMAVSSLSPKSSPCTVIWVSICA